MHCQRKEEVKRMSEKLYGVDQFYPGDFAPILTGIYTLFAFHLKVCILNGIWGIVDHGHMC